MPDVTDIDYAVAEGRAAAEALMVDLCYIARPTGVVTTDPNTGAVTPGTTPVYGTAAAPAKCKVQAVAAQEQEPDVGGAAFTVQRYRVDVPVAKTAAGYAPKIGDVVHMVTVRYDPHLAGREYRVVALLHKSMATAYRLGVEEA